tara:strand:- start:647 stop:940 length:294 start_codon:yes stop_codon:yes gene_type:complete
MVTSLAIALAISLTGQVEDNKICYKKCTGHNDDVIHLDIKYHPDAIDLDGGSRIKEWICQGEAEGFRHTISNKLTCDGSNHEEWETEGINGECFVCY